MPGSARRQLRLRPEAVALALGKTIELQHDADVVGQHSHLDAAAQAAQAQCDYRLVQLGRAGDVAALGVERDGNVKSVAAHRRSLQAHLASVGEHRWAVSSDVLVKPQAKRRLGQDRGDPLEVRKATLDRRTG